MLITELVTRNVARRGDHPFIIHEGRRVSYREFDRLTNQAARALLSLGVAKGDRVTLAMGNSVDYLVATFGVLKVGAIYNPVNPALGARELSYVFGHADPHVIITDATNLPSLQSPQLTKPATARLAVTSAGKDGIGGDVIAFGELVDSQSDEPPPVILGPDDPSTLLYTSGTTGNPKGVLFHHGSTGAAGQHFLDALAITADDTILAVTPLFHGNAWGATGTALQAGGTVAFPKAFSGSEFWPLVHDSGATVLYTLGTILAILLSRPPTDLERTSKLRVILGLGSAPIRDAIIRRFGVIDVAECFGSTDAGVVTITPLGAAPRAGSCGPPVGSVKIRVVDDDDQPLPTRSVGEIVVHSPHRMAAYFHDPDQTAQALRHGGFHTGDLGYVDEDGWLYFVDRKRDVIRRGGENVSSVLIEKTLREHPHVVEVAVIGIPDPVLGQEIKAYVVTNAAVSETELAEFAAARLAKFQVPRLWEFRDSLPKTPTQRVEKYKLRQEAGGTDKPLLG